MENKKEHVKKVTMPHILVLFPIIIIVFSLLTYVLPGGSYELDSAGKVIAGTFTPAEAVPFSPWKALLSVRSGIIAQASMISQMLVIGGAISVVLATECFENIMNYAVYKLQDKSVKILVPCIVTMMSLLGAFAGSDSMIIFVTVGILICRKLKLDRICAMAMFYLGYLIGQGASITSTVLINVQTMAEVPPLSDMAVRVPIWIIFTAVNAFYCTRYALKVYHDPNRSLLGCVLEETEDMGEIKEMKTPVTSIVLAVLMFATYVLYAIGGKNWGWGLDYLFALVILLAIASAIIARMPANKAAQTYFKGAQSMGGICLVFGLAKVVGTIITESTTVYWLAEVASNTFGKLGTVGAVLAIYVFILLFNLLIPSSSSKAAVLMPLLCPICDVLGIARGLLVTVYMIGDSLTNTLTPVSGPLCGSLGLAEVDYTDWIKYAAPLMGILIVVGAICLAVISAMGIFA